MRLNTISVLTIFLGFITCNCFAQSLSLQSDGRDFYVGLINPSYNDSPHNVAGFFHTYLLISSYVDTKVQISYFDEVSGKEIIEGIRSIPSHTAVQIELDRSKMTMQDTKDKPEFRSCHIVAKSPVNVQFF